MKRPPSSPSGASTLSVASYNVHRCVGTDGRHDPARIATVLAELNVDAIGLQEVDTRYHIEQGMDQLDFLAQATGFHAVEGITLRRHDARYGNGLLTRYPVRAIERLDLSVPGREARGALDVVLDLGTTTVRLIVAHFGLRVGERRLQCRRLVDCLGELNPDEPVVVLGDFNEWRLRGGGLQHLESLLGSRARKRTYPSWRPLLALDRIWARPADVLSDLRVHDTRLARVASDHLPIRATINFNVALGQAAVHLPQRGSG